ncbi:MAG: adenylate kinase [Candidatus Nanopelagicales bacterium]
MSGGGKTRLSLEIARRLGLPVVHLDRDFWQPGWVSPEADWWRARVSELVAEPHWVMDGNYGRTLDQRVVVSDVVVFLDVPRRVALAGVLRRWWHHIGRTRPDLAPGCPERMDLAFLRWVWRYPKDGRPIVIDALAEVSDQVAIVRLQSRKEATIWVTSLPEQTDNVRPP